MLIRKLFKFENKPWRFAKQMFQAKPHTNKPWRFAKQMFILFYHMEQNTRQAKPHINKPWRSRGGVSLENARDEVVIRY